MRHIKGIVRLAVLVAAASIMAAGSPAAAVTRTWTGSVNPEWFYALNWTPAETPAYSDVLLINNGSPLTHSYVSVGNDGAITFNGPAASGTFGYSIFAVGYNGSGALSISNGAQVANINGQIGSQVGSTGTVTVDNGTWTNSGDLHVASQGNATLDILSGGAVSNTAGYIAHWGGSLGTVTVAGAGSTWTNSGKLYVGYGGAGALSISNGGLVSSSNGTSIAISSDGFGTVTVDNASWNNSYLNVGYYGSGELTISNGGQVENTDARIAYKSGSNGTATVDGAGSSWTSSEGLYVGGSSGAPGGTGTLNVSSGGQVNVADTLNVWGAGTIRLDSGSISATTIINQGQIMGVGQMGGDLTNIGDVSPGLSVGMLTVDGDYTQDSSGTLLIELGGTAPGSEHDVLEVTGAASLDGELNVVLDGYTPAAGDSFAVMTYASRTGEFADTTGWLFDGNKALVKVYGANALTLTATYQGDVTLDFCVDGLDYVAWSSNYLTGDTWQEGDLNADGIADGLDYVIWSSNYLQGCPGLPGVVPEPGALSLLALGVLGLRRRSRA